MYLTDKQSVAVERFLERSTKKVWTSIIGAIGLAAVAYFPQSWSVRIPWLLALAFALTALHQFAKNFVLSGRIRALESERAAHAASRRDRGDEDRRKLFAQFADTRARARDALPKVPFFDAFDFNVPPDDGTSARRALQDLSRIANQFAVTAHTLLEDAKMQSKLLSDAHALSGPSNTIERFAAYQQALTKADEHYSALERRFAPGVNAQTGQAAVEKPA